MQALGPASATILLLIAAAYYHLYITHRRRFALLLAIGWVVNGIYILIESAGSFDTSGPGSAIPYFASLPTTYCFYLAVNEMRFDTVLPKRKAVVLSSWTLFIFGAAIVAFTATSLDPRAFFIVLTAPGALFTAWTLFRLARTFNSIDSPSLLATSGEPPKPKEGEDGIRSFTFVLEDRSAALSIGDLLSRRQADSLPSSVTEPLLVARRLISGSLLVYSALQITYPFRHSAPQDLFNTLFWIALAAKLVHGGGLAMLLYSDFRQVQEILRERSLTEELGALTTSIQHDIRNPLANLRRQIDTFQRQYQADNRALEHLSFMLLQTERIRTAAEIIPAIRETSSESRRLFRSYNIVAIARDATQAVKRVDNFGNIIFRQDSSQPDIQVLANRERLVQAFVNIINNGVEACRARDSAAAPLIDVHCTLRRDDAESHVDVHIRDRGTGIPADVLPQVTMPLFSTKSDGSGNRGVGLFIASRIIGYHRGRMRFQTDSRTFTEVTCEFPLAEASANR